MGGNPGVLFFVEEFNLLLSIISLRFDFPIEYFIEFPKSFEDFVLYDPGPGMLLLEDWNFFNLENFLDIIDLPIVLL